MITVLEKNLTSEFQHITHWFKQHPWAQAPKQHSAQSSLFLFTSDLQKKADFRTVWLQEYQDMDLVLKNTKSTWKMHYTGKISWTEILSFIKKYYQQRLLFSAYQIWGICCFSKLFFWIYLDFELLVGKKQGKFWWIFHNFSDIL